MTTARHDAKKPDQPPKPTFLKVDPDGIPKILKDMDRWVAWRYEWKPGQDDEPGKWAKVPKRIDQPRRGAKSNDHTTWATYRAAERLHRAGRPDVDGIGFVLGDGIVGVDIDNCRDPDSGKLDDLARRWIERFDSYAEVSVSSTGIHIFAYGKLPGAGRNVGDLEIYDQGRYFTMTGWHIEGTPTTVEERQEAVLEFYEEIGGSGSDERDDDDDALIARARDENETFDLLWRGEWEQAGYASQSEADLALCSLLRRLTAGAAGRMDELFKLSGLMRAKWDEKRGKKETYGSMTLEKALREQHGRLTPDDFFHLRPDNRFIYRATGGFPLWPAASVDDELLPVVTNVQTGQRIKGSTYVRRHRGVRQLTWSPGDPEEIKDRLLVGDGGGWISDPGSRVYNRYRAPRFGRDEGVDDAPTETTGERQMKDQASPWLDHLRRLFVDQETCEHLVSWFAHRIQRPGEKINHGVLMIGPEGCGKDTLLAPVRRGVGEWNTHVVKPEDLLDNFTPWAESVLLHVNEARDQGEVNRYALYERLKAVTAAPPAVLTVNRKHQQHYWVPNVIGVVVTSNHIDGLYLPGSSRRFFVAQTEVEATDLPTNHFTDLWRWYEREGGDAAVVRYLLRYDLSEFDPKRPPPKTAAFWNVVHAGSAPEDTGLENLLEQAGRPEAVTIEALRSASEVTAEDLYRWLSDRKNSRAIPRVLERMGYVPIPNPNEQKGRWSIKGGGRTRIFTRKELTHRERLAAAHQITEGGGKTDMVKTIKARLNGDEPSF